MNEIANFTLGLIVGIGSMLLIIVLWGLMNISGQISREEERGCGWEEVPTLDPDLLKLDMGETLNRPDPQPEPLPADDDWKSS